MKCRKCGIDKLLTSDNFYWRNDTANWRKTCKECGSKRAKNNYIHNKNKILLKAAEYRNNNRDKIKKFMKE